MKNIWKTEKKREKKIGFKKEKNCLSSFRKGYYRYWSLEKSHSNGMNSMKMILFSLIQYSQQSTPPTRASGYVVLIRWLQSALIPFVTTQSVGV